MAIIDYHSIRSGKYAQLSPSAKALIPVLSTLCDNYTGEIPDDDSAAAALAAYAGISERSVRTALAELAEADHQIVALDTKNGRIPSIQYRPQIRLGKKARIAAEQQRRQQTQTSETVAEVLQETHQVQQENAGPWEDPDLGSDYPGYEPPSSDAIDLDQRDDLPADPPNPDLGNGCRGTSEMVAADPGNGCRGQSDEKTPQTPAPTGENQNGKNLALNNSSNYEVTTTDLPVSTILIQEMTEKCGSDVVVKVISGMEELEKLTPGHIYMPEAYFRKCCEKAWTPTCKELQEKEKAKERRKREKERQEKERYFQETAKRRIQQEQNDPEAQARIAASQAEFWKNMDTPPPNATSGHALPASSFA